MCNLHFHNGISYAFSWVFGIPKQLYELHCPNFQILWNTEKVNQRLKSQTPPYLPNGDSVKEFFYFIGFRTLENEGVGRLQIYKKNRNQVKMPIK
jgi:hypothetical protein